MTQRPIYTFIPYPHVLHAALTAPASKKKKGSLQPVTALASKEMCVCVVHTRLCCVFPANTCQDLFKPRFLLKCHPARIHYVPFIN